jgi:hypothetical protein
MANKLFTPSLALVLALSAVGQEAVVSATAPANTFVLDVGSHAIPELVDRVAAFVDCNILYNAAELEGNGKIRTTRRTEVDKKGCWELFGSLLYHKGLAIVTLDEARGFHEVISMHGPRAREIANGAMFVDHTKVEAYANLKATPILTSVPLKNINATIATNALRPFFASTGAPSGGGSLTLGNVGNNSDMLLQGYGPQVAAACRLLRLVDVGSGETNDIVQVVRLEHAAPGDVVASLEATWAGRAAFQNMQAQGLPTPAVPLRIVAHPPQNAIILSGSSAQIRDAMQLIAQLDHPAVAAKASEDLVRRVQELEAKMQALEGRAPRK